MTAMAETAIPALSEITLKKVKAKELYYSYFHIKVVESMMYFSSACLGITEQDRFTVY